MSEKLKVIGALLLIALVLGGVLFYEVAVWSECRQTNSWWYCLRILSK
jgi:hypothetical protein